MSLHIKFFVCALFLTFLLIEVKSDDTQTCGENEDYSQCGVQCQRTCADVGTKEKLCNHMCAIGCFCKPGYVRQRDDNSPCVKESQC